MNRGQNIVLYALDNGAPRRPLMSCSPDDKSAAMKLQHAAFAEFQRAEKSGIAHPELRCISETREADERGIVVRGEFVELNTLTLEPLVDPVDDIERLFPVNVVVVSGADAAARAAAEANIQKIIADAVANALVEQRKAIEATPGEIPAVVAKAKKSK